MNSTTTNVVRLCYVKREREREITQKGSRKYNASEFNIITLIVLSEKSFRKTKDRDKK